VSTCFATGQVESSVGRSTAREFQLTLLLI